jgi:hypothetical protein
VPPSPRQPFLEYVTLNQAASALSPSPIVLMFIGARISLAVCLAANTASSEREAGSRVPASRDCLSKNLLPPPHYFTVSATFTLRVRPAPAAVIKKCELPVAAPDFLVRVIVDEPFPGEPTVCGLRLAVIPVGNPETEKASGELKPPKAVVVSFNAPLADA